MMATIAFTKMHGLGNCYVYIDAFKHRLDEKALPDMARRLSDVHTGIGSDGIILIGPSSVADLKMRIFNKDGSEAKNCGNGLRCVATYAFDNKLVASKLMTIETLGGILKAEIKKNQTGDPLVTINMGKPILSRQNIPMTGQGSEKVIAESFEIEGHLLKLTAVSMGNPHAVFFVPDIKNSPHETLGKMIEKDKRFPEGINVEFIQVKSPVSLDFRVWERGSGVTKACGTGACAAVVASVLNGFSKKNEEVQVHLEGGDLFIQWLENGDVLMTGPASYIASGTFIQ